MSVVSSQNVISVLIGKSGSIGTNDADIKTTATCQITDPGTTTTFIGDGQIVILGSDGNVMQPTNANISANPFIQFVQGSGATAATRKLNFSARIRGIDVMECLGKTYSAPAEQVTVIGYNGTTGSIDTTQGPDFMLTLVETWDDKFWSEQQNRKAYEYYSTAATQYLIAKSMVEQINYDGFRALLGGTGQRISATMLSDGTFTANGANACTVVNGSDIVTEATSRTYSIGDNIRIGGTGNTVAVYVVTATSATDSTLSALQYRLNTYYQGASATVSNANWGKMTVQTNFGIKLAGLPLTWTKDFFKYMKVSFHVDLLGFGSTTYTDSVVATKGNGYGQEVAEFESFAAGNEGALNRTMVPLPLGRTDASSTGTYSSIVMKSADRSNKSAITATTPALVQTYMFIPTTAALITQLLRDQLDPYLNSAGLPSLAGTVV